MTHNTRAIATAHRLLPAAMRISSHGDREVVKSNVTPSRKIHAAAMRRTPSLGNYPTPICVGFEFANPVRSPNGAIGLSALVRAEHEPRGAHPRPHDARDAAARAGPVTGEVEARER